MPICIFLNNIYMSSCFLFSPKKFFLLRCTLPRTGSARSEAHSKPKAWSTFLLSILILEVFISECYYSYQTLKASKTLTQGMSVISVYIHTQLHKCCKHIQAQQCFPLIINPEPKYLIEILKYKSEEYRIPDLYLTK